MEDAINQISAQIQTLRTTLDNLTAQLQSLSENVQPALQAITDSVGSIDTALADFDLEQPAQVVVGELNRLRDQVAALDAVSYTHLDVYKRQPPCRPLCMPHLPHRRDKAVSTANSCCFHVAPLTASWKR